MRISGIIIVILITIGIVGGCLTKESQTEIPIPTSISTTDSSKTRVNSEAGVTITAVNLGNNTFDKT